MTFEFREVEEFSKRCFDVVEPFRMSPEGQLILGEPERVYPLTEWAQHQLCKIAGCTPSFFEALADHNECEVFNKVIGDRTFLFRCVRSDNIPDYIRAVLSTHYNTEISNMWVINEIVKKVNFVKVLSSDDVQVYLKKFDVDYLGVEVDAGKTKLLVLNGETGRTALSFLIRVIFGGFPLSTTIHRKIHTNLDPSVTEDILLKSASTVVTKVNSLTPDILDTKFKVRKVDLKMFTYPKEIKSLLFDLSSFKTEGIVEVTLSQILKGASKVEDFRWNLILSCDLFNVCTSFSSYVKDGWIVKWPVRTNWLK